MKFGWNPVGVKPPSENADYLITDQDGKLDIASYNDYDFYGKSGSGNFRWHCKQYQFVIAWMPLPTPYNPVVDRIGDFLEVATDEELPRETYEKLWEIIKEHEE